jgi:adenosine deaminase
METIASADFISGLPKAELHLHIEGTLSVEMKRRFAERNGLTLGDASFAPLLQVSEEPSSQALAIQQYKMFLALYFEGLKVMSTEQDFYELALDYFHQCKDNNIVYAEVSFDPQAHTDRGVAFDAVIEGLVAAQTTARETLGVESQLIMCINRDLTLESAVAMMNAARPYRDRIAGLGLDNVEEGHPPNKFRTVYDAARDQGYRLTAHCDVDMIDAREHIRQCIHDIGVERIDHGINVLDDEALIDAALDRGIHFTACPTWRKGDPKPRRVDRIEKMRNRGLSVSLNTDDPAYFASGYLNNMLNAVAATGQWDTSVVVRHVKEAFVGAWIDEERRAAYIRRVDDASDLHNHRSNCR